MIHFALYKFGLTLLFTLLSLIYRLGFSANVKSPWFISKYVSMGYITFMLYGIFMW